MNIAELYKNKFTLSFEIFPPKTEKGMINLFNELESLSKYDPGYISVTYGAGGSTQSKTLDIATRIKNDLNLTPLVHFTCVGSNRDEIKEYLDIVKKNKISNILALRGDPPQGETEFKPVDDGFSYANELIEYINTIENFNIAVAGYPEGHLEAKDFDTDIENLKRKVDTGADFIITQLFYDNNNFYDYMDKIEKVGIKIPVIPGIMPVTNQKQVERITDMCGAKIPQKLINSLTECKIDEPVCDDGIDFTINQCNKLINWGVKGFHFYTLNKSDIVERIIKNLNLKN